MHFVKWHLALFTMLGRFISINL